MRKVYLDNVVAAPLHPEVLEAMLPYLRDTYGNPQSIHSWGNAPWEAMGGARAKLANLIGGQAEEIIFTSGGTESNNFALKGLAQAYQARGKHIVISAIEHLSVMNSVRTLEKRGFAVTRVPVDGYGLVKLDELTKSIREDTIIVSIMHSNSEVGTIQNIKEIAKLLKSRGIVFHTDAVASVGTIPVDVKDIGVDALSLAANQFYGPKGAGALWVRKGVRIIPLLDGGGQEGGRRAGTENVPAIVGMGKAAELAQMDMPYRTEHLSGLRQRLIKGMTSRIEQVLPTGHPDNRLPGNASFCIEFIEGEAMLMRLSSRGIAASSGSACTSMALKASHVLTAMGISPEIAQSSLLFTLMRDNTEEDIEYVLEALPPIVDQLRQMSPLYAKFLKKQSGGR